MAITPERMEETYVVLATDPSVANITLGYWDEYHRQVRSNQNSYHRAAWRRLWAASGGLLRDPVG